MMPPKKIETPSQEEIEKWEKREADNKAAKAEMVKNYGAKVNALRNKKTER
jgi:hypothetical protein